MHVRKDLTRHECCVAAFTLCVQRTCLLGGSANQACLLRSLCGCAPGRKCVMLRPKKLNIRNQLGTVLQGL